MVTRPGTLRIALLGAAMLCLATLACNAEEPSGGASVSPTPVQVGALSPAPEAPSSPAAETARAARLTPSLTPTATLLGDFGDAPDGLPAGYPNPRVVGRFPTRLRTDSAPGPGAHVLNPSQDRLGDIATQEAAAEDPRDPDGQPNLVNTDEGDDGVQGLTLELDATPVQARMSVHVTIAPHAPPGPRFINVLIDIDRDGRWGGAASEAPEWAVVNWRVTLNPGTGVTLQSPAFQIVHQNQLPHGAWLRVLLTREPLGSAVWDGSGRWDHGEVEDYQLSVGTERGESAPLSLVRIECPTSVPFERAFFVVEISCAASNLGADGTLEARIFRAFGETRLIPDRIEPRPLRAGMTSDLPFVIIRDEGPSRWRYGTQSTNLTSSVADGVITIGTQRSDRRLEVPEVDAVERFFRDDEIDDHFSVITGERVEGFAFGDIRRAALGRARLDTTGIDLLRRELVVIEPAQPPPPHEDYVAVLIQMADRLPIAQAALGFQLGVVFESTGDPGDDWRPLVRGFDLFQGTDQWYELIYRPNLEPAWRLQRRDAAEPNLAAPTDARAFLLDDKVLMLIPAGEFTRAPETLRYRVTTFVHEPDDPTGESRPSAADVLPELHEPLAVYGTSQPPLG